MDAMYDEIVEFSELHKFMDQKLKNYSSGMQVRLAFSIAIQAKSDILVLDEVLAVGDAAFQQKCTSIFEQYKARKQTVVLVTHSMETVEQFCSRAMMLDKGEIVKIGDPKRVGDLYSEKNRQDYITAREKANQENKKADFTIETLDSKKMTTKTRFKRGEEMLVRLKWSHHQPKNAGIAIIKQSGEYIFGPASGRNFSIGSAKEIYYKVKLNVNVGEYYLKASISTKDKVHSYIDDGPVFMVEKEKDGREWGGVVSLPHEWLHNPKDK